LTALLHRVNIDLLRDTCHSLKKWLRLGNRCKMLPMSSAGNWSGLTLSGNEITLSGHLKTGQWWSPDNRQ
jgi:hypothetical protein